MKITYCPKKHHENLHTYIPTFTKTYTRKTINVSSLTKIRRSFAKISTRFKYNQNDELPVLNNLKICIRMYLYQITH